VEIDERVAEAAPEHERALDGLGRGDDATHRFDPVRAIVREVRILVLAPVQR
jgi:hypothetical protein